MTENDQPLSPNKQALLKIRELKQQLAAAQDCTGEPIAIVSMACRFPRSSDTPEKFWQSLIEQQDLVGEIPGDRWDLEAFHDDDPDVPGKMYARKGVFLESIDQMDPEFFGISPREATWVDPQQRLLMEVGWEAIERAGWIPEQIGDHTGVFVGWMHNDYQNEASDSFLNLNPYIATGAAGSFLCGRLAYYLGLQGPSVAVDTACSSSLVALHLAIQSLQRRDCDRALVGGVNAICSPTTNILTCKLKALSPQGHSRAFDAEADGYLRGEGCGMVTLRRLSDAEDDGDSVLGVIRGSAVGHNGFSSGLTAPNPKAQEKVICQALERAGIDANQVDYLEAHGTGTELGDPIEVTAASAAYCQNRTGDNPLLIGSVKTNIGHLEAAAGMAGLIKVLLAIQNESIPGQMNFETPNPHIPWSKIPVKVLTEPTSWPASRRRIAGVSAFGMSGTNAHVVIEAPATEEPTSRVPARAAQGDNTPAIITLSAKHDVAVFELAAAYAGSLSQNEACTLTNFAAATNVTRSHFEHRAAIVATSKQEAIRLLELLGRGSNDSPIFMSHRRRAPRVAWQFTGQGSQYVGMGRQLYETQPVFRDAVDQCDAQLKLLRDGSLLSVLFDDDSERPAINNTHWTQPAIFALQMGLAKLLESWNMTPDVVLGHSVGQYAAACVAHIMTWDDGLRLIAERGRLIGELPTGGEMLAVFAPAEAVQSAIVATPKVSIAAHNGTHIVISGDETEIRRIDKDFIERGIRTRKLTTSHAFHSHLMDPVLDPFAAIADQVDFQTASMPLVCNVTGQVLPTDKVLDGAYWAEHIRQAVRFAPSVEALSDLNCDLLIELGPQSVLTRMAAANWKQPAETLISCLQKGNDAHHSFALAVAQMYAQGVNPDFHAMHGEENCVRIDLPTYPFQRRRFWGPDKPRASHAEYHTAHPLLGSKISLAGSTHETRYEGFVDTDSPAWLPDHEVMNAVVLPGAALLEMAITAAGSRVIENAVFEQPVRPTGRTALQTVVRKTADENPAHFKLETYASPTGSKNWTRHYSCDLLEREIQQPDPVDRQAIQANLKESDTPENFYQKMSSLGLNYGPAFRCIDELHYSEQQVLTHLKTASDVRGYTIPPTLLDAALHSLAVGLIKSTDDDNLFLPVGMGRIEVFGAIEAEAWCLASWKQSDGASRTADVVLFSEHGKVLLTIEDLRVQEVSLAAMRQMSGAGAGRLVYELEWKQTRLTPTKLKSKKWLVISHAEQHENSLRNLALGMIDELRAQDHEVYSVYLKRDATFSSDSEHEFEFCGQSRASWDRLLDRFSDGQSESQIDGIAWCLGSLQDHLDSPVNWGVESILSFVQAALNRNWRRLPCGLQLITSNAINAGSDEQTVSPQQTQFWGLGRVLGAEQPELRCRMLDVCATEFTDEVTARLATEIALTETTDNQHVIRNGQLFVPRMIQARLKKSSPFHASEDGCYLVTGGLGKLGRLVAKWLADHGARQIVLVSRRQPNDEVRLLIDSIEHTGCQVEIHPADLSSRDDVESLFARFGNDLNRLAGVVHAAGVLDDGLIDSQTVERFASVLKPKITAARWLDELTQELDLDLFVLYSSAASVLGSPGQSNYATGNAYLDGLAFRRRQLGLPAVAINWGPWTEGMADDPRILKRLALQGITPLSVDEAHAALDQMLANETIQATVLDVDWRKMRIGPTGDVPAMLQELVGSRKKSRATQSALVSKLKQLRGKAQRDLLLKTIQDSLQGILSTNEAPETDRPLIEMGLDSLMAVEFGTELQQMLGDQFNVGPTMLFDHPTIDAITDHVLDLVASDDSEPAKADHKLTSDETQPGEAKNVTREDIAIVGMSCRFPGAQNVNQFWQNLLNGVDSVCDIPNDRWDIDRFYSAEREPGKMYTRRGGFLNDIADFDADFFNISDQEACWIDPQHRLLLENSHNALEDAGIPTSPLADANVGVFMGIMGSDYAFLPTLDDEEIIKGFQGAGLSHSAGVGRISYLFGFEGPSVAVDTASSSSLVAVYQAMRSLQDGNCNLALAGGVNAILAPVNSLLMSKAGLLSPDGRCKSFSKSADGFGRGEGCGVVVLKRLSDAERDGDRIMAVIRGGAVVHNGFSGGITSPSGKAQTRVIDAAIKDAGLAPSQVQYLEAHGTGTEYGDPMELGAAIKIYGKGRSKENPLLVGSVKANISHLEAAGGSSGLIKTVLAIHHGLIPPQIHFSEPSPHIPWKRMPVKMVCETTPWPACDRRTAGITALGLVGTNAHLVVSGHEKAKEGEAQETDPTASKQRLLLASARSENALKELCRSYATYLEANPHIDLDDFCFTLAAGRRHYEQRIALSFSSHKDAVKQLTDFVRSDEESDLTPNGNGKARAGLAKSGGSDRASAALKLAWVFAPGGMDARSKLRGLAATYSVVDDFVKACSDRIEEHLGASGNSSSLVDLIASSQPNNLFSQTMEYVLQASLAKLWLSWEVQPDAAVGSGVGQYTAAAVAGCLCFLDALVLVHEREKLLANSAEDGDWDSFEKMADSFNFYPPNLPLVCSVSGDVIPVHRSPGGSYWRQHATVEPKIADSVQALASLNGNVGMVLGTLNPNDTLLSLLEKIELHLVGSAFAPAQSSSTWLLSQLGHLYELGCNPNFAAVFSNANRQRLSLPTYPFQRKRYWITEIAKFMEAEETAEAKSVHS